MIKTCPMPYLKPMKHLSRIGCLTLAFFVAFGPSTSSGEEVLNNGSVIELQKLNLGDAVIIDKIHQSKCTFDTSMNGLKELKSANLSSAVIQVMLAKATPSGNPPAENSAPANINDPASPHSPGIWVLQETNGTKFLSKIDFETAAEVTHGGFIGPFGAGKMAMTARLTGTGSPVQLSQHKPEFYLYTGEHPGSLQLAENPSELSLCAFTVIQKDAKRNANQRAVDIATIGAYAMSHGVDKKAIREFDSQKIVEGIYKITARQDLPDGEYAFCSSVSASTMGGGSNGRYFTFGIHSK